MENKIRVLEAMIQFGKPASAKEIAILADMAKEDVDKAMKELKKEGAIVSPVRCKWEPVNGTGNGQ